MNRLQAFQSVPHRAVALLIPVCALSLHVALMAATLQYTLLLTMIGLMVACILPPAGSNSRGCRLMMNVKDGIKNDK
jgi:hypothetical protein